MHVPPHIALLDSPSLSTTLAATGTTYTDRVAAAVEQFVVAVSAADASDPVVAAAQARLPEALELCASLIDSAHLYLDGYPARALNRLAKALDTVEKLDSLLLVDVPPDQLSCLFRARVFDGVPHTGRRDLFHIPTTKRHLAGSSRFSIPGFPCLYLGTTSLVCWHELGRPSLHSMAAARFQVSSPTPVRLFSLALPPLWIKYRLTAVPPLLDPLLLVPDYVAVWPLVAACGAVVRERTAPFKEEYILPQLMLQWVTENRDIVALTYNSNRLPAATSPRLTNNLVFPSRARKVDDRGHYEDLLALFECTDPLPWALRHADGLMLRDTPSVGIMNYDRVVLVGESPTDYSRTTFYDYDSLLAGMEATRL